MLLARLYVHTETPEYDTQALETYLEGELGQPVTLVGIKRSDKSTCPLLLVADKP